MRYALLLVFTIFLFVTAAKTRASNNQTGFPVTYIPTGAVMYRQFCASCHGVDAKGDGPAAPTLKMPPSDLTQLSRKHGGKFPYEYVAGVLRSGKDLPSHGSAEMPVWGPLFQFMDKDNKRVVDLRIQSLSEYLASVQTQ